MELLELVNGWTERCRMQQLRFWMVAFCFMGCCVFATRGQFVRKQTADAVIIKDHGTEMLRYQLTPPAGSNLTVESACYFHPVRTPKGVVVTDLAPADHRHHRGIFLGFLEVHGKKSGDFWGWGKYAPVEHRQILNRRVAAARVGPGFSADNDWLADGEQMVDENLEVAVKRDGNANVIDLHYTLRADDDTMLVRHAFGGFCVRVPKEKKPIASGPTGKVNLPLPNYMKPETDWPDAKWYDYTFADGSAGVAVINSSKNPPTLWHNQSAIGMLNPCITAPGAVTLKAGVPFELRYRVVVHDEPVSREQMEQLAKDF